MRKRLMEAPRDIAHPARELSSLFHARLSMNPSEDRLVLPFGAVDHPLDDAFLQSAYRAEVRMSVTETRSAVRSARDWAKALAVYRRPSAARGIFDLIATFPPFVAV